jgi:hypothetical protein
VRHDNCVPVRSIPWFLLFDLRLRLTRNSPTSSKRALVPLCQHDHGVTVQWSEPKARQLPGKLQPGSLTVTFVGRTRSLTLLDTSGSMRKILHYG